MVKITLNICGQTRRPLGLRITDAFAKYGWTSAIRGVEGGGKVEGMTAHTYKTNEGDIVLKCPTKLLSLKRERTK